MMAVFTTPDLSGDRMAFALSGPPPTAMTFGTAFKSEMGMPWRHAAPPRAGYPARRRLTCRLFPIRQQTRAPGHHDAGRTSRQQYPVRRLIVRALRADPA